MRFSLSHFCFLLPLIDSGDDSRMACNPRVNTQTSGKQACSLEPLEHLYLRLATSAFLSVVSGSLSVGAQLHLPALCFLPSHAYCRWSSPSLTRCSSVWNGAFFLLSPFRRDGFSSGIPNTNPHFIARAPFPSFSPPLLRQAIYRLVIPPRGSIYH